MHNVLALQSLSGERAQCYKGFREMEKSLVFDKLFGSITKCYQ